MQGYSVDTAEDASKKEEEYRRKNMEALKELLGRLNLSDRFKNKLSTSDVLVINTQSLQQNGPKLAKEIAFSFLNRLFMTDYRARYISIQKDNTDLLSVKEEIENGSQDVFASLFTKSDTDYNMLNEQSLIHPMDIQMAAFHSADAFLRQCLVSKLSMCQYALPLLVPNPFTSEIELPLWSLRQVSKSWKSRDDSGTISAHSELMYGVKSPMVAVFRLGSLITSKSKLLNNLINDRHSTFFHKDCPGSTRTSLLMDGVAEIAWYCPSGKEDDHFSECVAFCNLHGDGMKHRVQWRILSEMASVSVVFLPRLCKNDPVMSIVENLFSTPTPLICLLTEEDFVLKTVGQGKFRMGIKNRNESDIVQDLKKAISDSLSLKKFKLLNLSEEDGIEVDENNGNCQEGREAAQQITNLLLDSELATAKETFLPCQGKLWHAWCQKNKDLYRLHGNLEKEKTRINKDMLEMRSKQHEISRESPLMKMFLEALEKLSPSSRNYFLRWTSILMDSCTSDKLMELLHRYDQKWSSVLKLKKKNDQFKKLKDKQTELEDISDKLKDGQTELEDLSEQLNAATFGLEHILREMGQIFEAEMSVTMGKRQYSSNLPKIAAELFLSGQPLELMDGDAAHVPMVWVKAVLDEVIKQVGDKIIFVLSVLGIQSTGKSTMLNAMFGLQFAVSAGRCTRGAFMQLVKVTREIEGNVDYVLVVDTEGLRALELAGKATTHHDNELATFVIGLGHMTLINIFGENPAEMQNIIEIAVQAFLRMKKVKLTPSCIFVHQNVGDITAGEKNMEGKRRLQEKLDEMTKIAAKEEDCDAKSFSDVISFDIQQDVKYFAPLWEGSPPMAPPNPSYSENVQELKKTILGKVSKSTGLRLSEFKARISDLWNALLNESFVFSFKNTLEIVIYRALETEYYKWTWKLRGGILCIENELHNIIKNDILDPIDQKLLLEKMRPTYDEVKETMVKYFEDNKEKETLVQWRGKFELKISETQKDLVRETKNKLNDVIQQKMTRRKLDERKQSYEKELFKRSKELALRLKNTKQSEGARSQQFHQMWQNWLPELSSEFPRVQNRNIWEDIMSVLEEKYDKADLTRWYESKNYEKIALGVDFSIYVTSQERQNEQLKEEKKQYAVVRFLQGTSEKISRGFLKIQGYVDRDILRAEDQKSIHNLIENVCSEADKIIDKHSRPGRGYSTVHIQEIVNLVIDHVKVFEQTKPSQHYAFKKAFTADVCLHVCDVASKKLAELHEKFQRENDVYIYLNDQRDKFYNVFQNFCKGAESATVLGEFICSKLEVSISQAVYDQTAIDLVNEIQSNVPALNGNRTKMEKYILTSLAKEENFSKFLQYIHKPKEHFIDFIKVQVKEYTSTVKNPKLLSTINGNLKKNIKYVSDAAQTATEKVKDKKEDANQWLKHFSKKLRDKLEFPEKSYCDVSDITDFDFLEEVIGKGLENIQSSLENKFSKLSLLKNEMFRKRPDDILIDHFCNCCWVKCPFCNAICTGTMEDHDADHSVPFHRSYGISGMKFRGTKNLCIDFCTTSVASDRNFYPGGSDVSIPWKEYKRAGPKFAKWSITPDPSELPYWKWFVCRFKDDLEKHYNKTYEGHGEIPVEWKEFTKQQAIESLDSYL